MAFVAVVVVVVVVAVVVVVVACVCVCVCVCVCLSVCLFVCLCACLFVGCFCKLFPLVWLDFVSNKKTWDLLDCCGWYCLFGVCQSYSLWCGMILSQHIKENA